MTSPLQLLSESYFEQYLDVSFGALLAPISATAPCGQSARRSPCYAALQEARRQDDLSLPMGTWNRELKRADWNAVSSQIVTALQQESKDMQLLAWLQEAQIQLRGVAGISATLVLIRIMCERYWTQLHPEISDGDMEHRANLLSSIAEKNLPAIRLAPLIGIEREHPYSWADWEKAQRNEQFKSSKGSQELEGVTLQALQSALASADTDGFLRLHTQLQAALQAIAELSAALDPLFGEQAPSLGNMSQLLLQMEALIEGELHKRGVRIPVLAGPEQEPVAYTTDTGKHVAATVPALPAMARNTGNGAIRDRADAYARLAETAEFLMRLEPHSPVPYLVRRATEWGSLNTVELYQELFLRLGGQLNIFEMLGLESTSQQQHGA